MSAPSVVILCGGRGTRLREHTETIPKPLVDLIVAVPPYLNPGDEIYVTGDAGWQDLDMWVRITELSINPDNSEITLKVVTV